MNSAFLNKGLSKWPDLTPVFYMNTFLHIFILVSVENSIKLYCQKLHSKSCIFLMLFEED